VIDLRHLLDQVYDRAGYEVVIDYDQLPVPLLAEDEAAWVEAQLRAARSFN